MLTVTPQHMSLQSVILELRLSFFYMIFNIISTIKLSLGFIVDLHGLNLPKFDYSLKFLGKLTSNSKNLYLILKLMKSIYIKMQKKFCRSLE